MSGEATKEHVTTVHPSAIQIQNITTLQIKHHSDDIKTHMFRNSDVRHFTPLRTPLDLAAEEWTSEQVTAKAICLKNAQDSIVLGPLTILRRLHLQSEGYGCSRYLQRLNQLFKTPITAASVSFSVFLPDIQSSRSTLVRCLVESRVFLVLAILPLFVFSRLK